MFYLYVITNNINKKKYIGQTINVEKRKHEHYFSDSSGSKLVRRAIKKYGMENFDFQILCTSEKEEIIKELEIKIISSLNTMSPNGYNLTLGGEGTTGYKHTEKNKKIMSKLKKGIKQSEDQKRKTSERMKGNSLAKGYKHTEETLKLLSEQRKGNKNTLGRKLSEEEINKLSERMKGNKYTLGHVLSEEHKEKISKGNSGKKFTEEHKQKISNALKGKKFSEETRNKMSESRKGKKNSEETKNIMSEVRKKKLNEGGKVNSKQKLVITQVIEIRKFLAEGKKIGEISKLFNVSKDTIRSIKNGNSWNGLGLIP